MKSKFKVNLVSFIILFLLSAHVCASNIEPVSTVLQSNTITGTVTDENGETLPGVKVIIKGTTIGTVTNSNGDYTIKAEAGSVLLFSSMGYADVEIVITDRLVVNVTLRESPTVFDEVVVIGYGIRQRTSVTGAVDQVRSQTFENRPVQNTMQALQGSAPSLVIQQRNMNPNDNTMNINIRGISTMSSNTPLVVVDGMISTGTEALTANLNPNDIESITILKDAGSAAIYGSRSANGVILITTKTGAKNTRPRINFSGMYGVQVPELLFKPVAGWENAILRNQAQANAGESLAFTPEQIQDLYNNRGKDKWWADEIFQNAVQQSYDLGISGGSDNTTFRVSAGYRRQDSNFKGNIFSERYNFRTNLTTEWGRFKIASNLAYSRSLQRTVAGGTGNVITDAMRIPVYYYYPIKVDGKYLINDVNSELNPLAHLESGGWEDKDDDNIIGNLNLDFKIIEGLKARALFGIDLTQEHRFRRYLEVPLYRANDLETPARSLNADRRTDDYNNKRYTLNSQFMLDFNRTFEKVHNVQALLGVSNESYTRRQSMVAWLFTDPDLGTNNYPDASQAGVIGDNYTPIQGTQIRSINSLFGRALYAYDSKYFGEFAFRYDGSSRFYKKYRWGFFPSFSLAYMISDEGFMQKYKQNVGDLKLRATYGILGTQASGDYAFLTTYSAGSNVFVFDNVSYPGVNFSDGNEELTWEKSATFNIGFDATFLRNKNLSLSFDWFKNKTTDMLLPPQVPSVYGGGVPTSNWGEMENKGWEVTIGYRIKSGDFTHRVSFNIADQQNKVTHFGGVERINSGGEMWQLIREGEPLNAYYGYRTDGLFQSYEEIENSPKFSGDVLHPGDVKYVKTTDDGTGIIGPDDRVILGYAFPRYTFGLTYDVSWKGFDLSILAQGVGKRIQQVRGETVEPFHHTFWVATMYQHQLDYWTPTNTNSKNPRLVAAGPSRENNWTRTGIENQLFDMAYLRLKNLRIGYTLPQDISKRAGINKVRISVNAQNLFTLSHNSWVDPEGSNFGNDMGGRGGGGAYNVRGTFPRLKYYGIGLDLEF